MAIRRRLAMQDLIKSANCVELSSLATILASAIGLHTLDVNALRQTLLLNISLEHNADLRLVLHHITNRVTAVHVGKVNGVFVTTVKRLARDRTFNVSNDQLATSLIDGGRVLQIVKLALTNLTGTAIR